MKKKKGFATPQREPVQIEPVVEPLLNPAKELGRSLIGSFIAAVSWYILAPILFVMFFLVFGCVFFWMANRPRTPRQLDSSELNRKLREDNRSMMETIVNNCSAEIQGRKLIMNDKEGNAFLATQPGDPWGKEVPLRTDDKSVFFGSLCRQRWCVFDGR